MIVEEQLKSVNAQLVEVTRPALQAWLTVERGLYGIILILAGFLRLFGLGGQPLNPLEAANAWPAWLGAMAITAPTMTPPTSPLLYSLHTVLFWLTTGSDALTRLAPALAGIGLVLLAWWWRAALGRGAALLLALLWALDPWLVALSRLADGAMLSLALGLLTLTGLWHLLVADAAGPVRQRWGYITALSVGLLLVSGALAWSFLPVLFGFVWLFQPFGDQELSEDVAAAEQASSENLPVLAPASPQKPAGAMVAGQEDIETIGEPPPPPTPQPRPVDWLGIPQLAWIIAGVAAVLGSTTWLAQPANLGLISRSFSTWIGYLSGSGGAGYLLSWPFLRLWVDNLLLLVFGAIGMVQLWGKVHPQAALHGSATDLARQPALTRATHLTQAWRWFLTGWLVWGLILWLLPGRNPMHLPMLGIPLALLAATAGAGLLRNVRYNLPWLESGLLLGVLTALLVFLTFSGWYLLAQWQWEMRRALVLLLFLALAVLLIVIFALWANWPQTRVVVGSYVGLLLLMITLSSGWQLNHWTERGEFNGFFAHFTDPDVRRLADDVHTLSAQRTGDATQMPVLVQMAAQPDPVLGWYLRTMYNLRWVLAPAVEDVAGQTKPLVITLGETPSNDQQLLGYMGSRYALSGRWLPSQLISEASTPPADPNNTGIGARLERFWSGGARLFLRWVVYRKVTNPPPTEKVILWVGQ